MTVLQLTDVIQPAHAAVWLISKPADISKIGLNKAESGYIQESLTGERRQAFLAGPGRTLAVLLKDKADNLSRNAETFRKAAAQLTNWCNENKLGTIQLNDSTDNAHDLLAFAEGMLLANYQFLKYRKNPKKETNTLANIVIVSRSVNASDVAHLRIAAEATCRARDLVNEPLSTLDATALARTFRQYGRDAGFSVEILNRAKIESLKMGGLLAVNAGSDRPPTFTIMEYKPAKARNKKPVILVGKGVVFDTGGYNIKVGNHMETMKCDMAGAAAVGATLWAVAKAKLPVHVIGLVPATDNMVNGSGFVPGDVLTMYNGLTVEVLNTDAEGRLILADALSYGEKYSPELVIDLATLTGAAAAAIGPAGIVCMGTAPEKAKEALKASGTRVHERLAEFPFWDEYDELIKSDVAEIKNIGSAYAGAITAGKFLSHFVKSPWMHFDIAGPAFLASKDAYRPKGGTGVGVRLLFDFFKNYTGA
ncbi:MAG: leucyl aminopeptidase [Bacteroidia bacterium]|jgi:leucyl aminopeptidase|nr:leucyl aminopeptidase [Bacteroidia bacterium]